MGRITSPAHSQWMHDRDHRSKAPTDVWIVDRLDDETPDGDFGDS